MLARLLVEGELGIVAQLAERLRAIPEGDGTVLDNLTGLIWLKNADCFGVQTWTNALISYYSNLNETYDDKMWIMRVTPNQIT